MLSWWNYTLSRIAGFFCQTGPNFEDLTPHHCLKSGWVISTGLILTLLRYLFTSSDLSVTGSKKKGKLENYQSIVPAFIAPLCLLKNSEYVFSQKNREVLTSLCGNRN